MLWRAGGGTCVWLCKAWLAVLDRNRDLNRASQGRRSSERDGLCSFMSVGPFAVVFMFFFWPFHFSTSSPSHHFFLFLLSICYSLLSSLSVLWSASCVALAHAGSQHQSTLVRDFWVFNHTLPQPLLLPVGVHPVYLVPVAFALSEEETNK